MTSNLSNIFFVQDFFREELLGGAESNDSVLISHLSKKYSIKKIKSYSLTGEMLESNKKELFIFSNFTLMPVEIVNFVAKNNKYIIYEHDHKYVNTRDPSRFKNFLIPKESIINYDFYKNAKSVVVLSKICKEILEDNLNIHNVHSIGCSLWSDKKFSYIKSICSNPKNKKYAVLNSENPVKGRSHALEFCKNKNIKYDLISSNNEEKFLEQLSKYETLIFFPQVLETFCRLAAEAKMLNCNLLTRPNLLGIYSEECFNLKGYDLIRDLEVRVSSALVLFDTLIGEAVYK
jgi:hypothetical protein